VAVVKRRPYCDGFSEIRKDKEMNEARAGSVRPAPSTEEQPGDPCQVCRCPVAAVRRAQAWRDFLALDVFTEPQDNRR
jgi:hypothetical protein